MSSSATGFHHDRKYWTSVLRQSIVSGYIAKDIENYGLLHLGKNAESLEKSKGQSCIAYGQGL